MGCPPDYLLHYTACPNEQKSFYTTDAWRCRAAGIKVLEKGRCKECGRTNKNTKIEVHHREPIYGMFTGYFIKNFESNRLLVLCKECHEKFHREHDKEVSEFVPKSEELSVYRRRVKKAHDSSCICGFCFGFDSVSDFLEPFRWDLVEGF